MSKYWHATLKRFAISGLVQCVSNMILLLLVIACRRTNSSWCIQDKNECAWCKDRNHCFAFVEYVPRYIYGGCTEWVDSLSVNVNSSCRQHTSCSSCISDFMCGWCGNRNNPRIGVCYAGDFSGNNSSAL